MTTKEINELAKAQAKAGDIKSLLETAKLMNAKTAQRREMLRTGNLGLGRR